MGWCIKKRKLITKSNRIKNIRKSNKKNLGRKGIAMLSVLIGKEDYAGLQRRAQDRRNWTMENENEGQEPAD